MTRHLASVITHGPNLYLSEAGTWLVRSAFGPKSPQKLRRFKYGMMLRTGRKGRSDGS